MALTLIIATFAVFVSIIYIVYFIFNKKRLPNINKLSYLTYGIFGLMAGLTLLALIFVNALVFFYNLSTNSNLDSPRFIDIKEYTYALTVGGLLAVVAGLEKIKFALSSKKDKY